MSNGTGGSGGGTPLESLGLGFDTSNVEKGIATLEQLGGVSVKTIKSVDDLGSAISANSKWIAESNQKWQNKIQILEAAWKAEQAEKKAIEDSTRAIEQATVGATNFIAKLQEMVRTYGMSREELLRYQAAQLGVTKQAEEHISKLEQLRQATAKYGVVIKDVGDIEKARMQWEEANRTALNAQRIRALNDQARAEEAAARERIDLANRTETILLAQKRRALAESAAAEKEAEARMEASRISLNAQRIREMAANRAEANRILDQMAADAVRKAERQALDEIKWAETSLKARIAMLEQLAKYKADPRITQGTIDDRFSQVAQSNLRNYNSLLAEYKKTQEGMHEAHRKGAQEAQKFSDVIGQISFRSARARSELIVLAHEAVTGNWRRFPASMMVLGEYTNAGALVFSALGASILGVTVALGALAVGIGAGILQQHEMNNALNRTNAAAGATINTLTQMAMTAGGIHGNMSDAYEATTKLAATGLYTAEQIGQISRAATQVAHVFRVDVNTTIQEFEALVVKGTKVGAVATYGVTRAVQLLDEKYHFLTVRQMAHIVQLEAEGKQREASAESIRLLADEHEKAAKRSKEYTGYIQTAWHNITGAIDTAIQRVKDWGAAETLAHKLRDVNERIRNTYDRPSGNTAAGDAARKKLEDERKGILAQMAAEEEAGKKKVEQAQRTLEANRALGAMVIEDVRLMRKSGSELERALEEHRERVKDIKAAIPDYFDSPEKQKYLADREAAIIREHTRKTGRAVQDGRNTDLASQLDHIQKMYEMTVQAGDAEMKLIQQQERKASIGQEEGYERRVTLRERELQAIEQMEKDKLAVIEKYNPTNKKDQAVINKRRQELADEVAAARQKLKIEQEADDARYGSQMTDKWIDGITKAGKAEIEQVEKLVEAQKKRNAELGRTKEELDAAQAVHEAGATAYLESELEAIELLQTRIALLVESGDMTELQANRVVKAYEAESARIRELIAARKGLQAANEEGAKLERQFELQKKYDQEWKRTFRDIEEGLYSAIGNGGGNALKRLISDFKAEFAKLILRPIIQPIAQELTNWFNPQATQAGGVAGANAAGGLGRYVSMAQSAASAYKMLSSGFAGVGNGLVGGLGSAIEGFGTMIGNGSIASYGAGMGAAVPGSANAAMYASASGAGNVSGAAGAGNAAGGAIGGAATVLAGALAGHMGGRALSNGFSAFGGSGNSAVNTGTGVGMGVGAVVGGPVGAAIGALVGGLIGGAVNRLFGHKEREITDTGMSGHVSSDGTAAGQTYAKWIEKGGIFRSDKTGIESDPIKDDMLNSLKSGLMQMKAITSGFAKNIGVSDDPIANYGKNFDLDFGKDGKKAEEAIAKLFTDIGDELATKVLPDIAKFALNGETAAATLERLSNSFQLTNDIATQLGLNLDTVFGGKGMESWINRDRLINMAGGIDKLQGLSNNYANNYLTEEEKLAPVSKAVAEAMAELGFASVDTRDKFKETVSSLDLTTEAGTKTFLSLMQLSDAFALVHEDTRKAENDAQKEKDILAERQKLQDQLDDLTLTSTQLREKERNALHESNRALYDQIKAIEDQKQALEDAKARAESLLSAADDAFSILERVIQREKDKLQKAHEAEMKALDERIEKQTEAFNNIKGVADGLKNSLNGMSNPIETNNSFTSSMQELERLLVLARKGGAAVLNQDDVNKAVAGVGNQRKESYSNEADYMRDFFRTRNALANLSGIADVQLSVEEKTLKVLEEQKEAATQAYEAEIERLDTMLETNRTLIEEAKGQSVSLLSIEQAVQGVLLAIANIKNDPIASGGADIEKFYQEYLGRGSDKDGKNFWNDQLAGGIGLDEISGAIKNSPEAKLRKMYKDIFNREADGAGLSFWLDKLNGGMSLDTIAGHWMTSDEYKNKLTKFDVGTNYVPYDMPAMVHEGERIVPKADNEALISSIGNNQNANGALIQEVRSLRAEVKGLRVENKAGMVAMQRDTAEIANKTKRWEGQGVPVREKV
jgi:hypothetical protein